MKNFFKIVLISGLVSLVVSFIVVNVYNDGIIPRLKESIQEVDNDDDRKVKEVVYKTTTETNYEELYDEVVDGVVYIETNSGTGSGFIYKIEDDYAYVLTNEHVVSRSRNIQVVTNDEKETDDVTYLGGDEFYDIAVLKVKLLDGMKKLEFGNLDDCQIGESVMAIGSPLGRNYINTATLGIISGKERFVLTDQSSYWGLKLIQTDAAISPGNSGGPLFTMDGKVVGVNSLKDITENVEGMGFAIPSNSIVRKLPLLEEDKEIRSAIGISLSENSGRNGVTIAGVERGGAAAEADILKGDIIISIEGTEVNSLLDIRKIMHDLIPGDVIDLVIERDGKIEKLKLTLGTYEG